MPRNLAEGYSRGFHGTLRGYQPPPTPRRRGPRRPEWAGRPTAVGGARTWGRSSRPAPPSASVPASPRSVPPAPSSRSPRRTPWAGLLRSHGSALLPGRLRRGWLRPGPHSVSLQSSRERPGEWRTTPAPWRPRAEPPQGTARAQSSALREPGGSARPRCSFARGGSPGTGPPSLGCCPENQRETGCAWPGRGTAFRAEKGWDWRAAVSSQVLALGPLASPCRHCLVWDLDFS